MFYSVSNQKEVTMAVLVLLENTENQNYFFAHDDPWLMYKSLSSQKKCSVRFVHGFSPYS